MNPTLRLRFPVFFIVLLLLSAAAPAWAQCDQLEFCQLVWSDEFDGSALDESKWSFQRGDGSEVGLPRGWGNGELQWYTDQNTTVADGLLTITARRETVEPSFDFTSARIRSLFKADFQYGRMEMRARMPIGAGLWPAFWMLPSDRGIYGGWAASGEIDIMEYIGSNPNNVLGTIHYGGEWPANTFSKSEYQLPEGTFNEDFHVFAIEWEEEEIRWYMDDVHYGTQTQWYSTNGDYPAPFNQQFHLLLNMAVGGGLPGPPNASTQFPQEFVIDYVRVYKTGTPTFDGATSGTYVVDGLNDQGFFVTVGENDSGRFVFIAWFTFDEAGNQRWLVGNSFLDDGAASIELGMQQLSGLNFLDFSGGAATRQELGTMTLHAGECGSLLADYDFGAGSSGSMTLTKLTNIEGRDCGP